MKLPAHLLLTLSLAIGFSSNSSAQNNVTLAAVYGESEPYYSSSLPGYGYYGRIVSAAFEQSGYAVHFHTDNWSRAIRDTAEANYDILAGGWATESRKQTFLISDPYAFNRIVFIKQRDSRIQTVDMSNPLGLRFALVRNSYTAELVTTPNASDTILVADSAAVLRMVQRGRVDLGALEEKTALSLIRDYFSGDGPVLDFLPEPAADAATSIMVSRQHPEGPAIIEAFNEGLRRLIESGEYAKLLEGSGLEGTMINRSGAALQN